MKSLQEQLAEIEMMAEKATPGPWVATEVGAINLHKRYDISGNAVDFGGDSVTVCEQVKDKNQRFIAASRTLIPQLVAALRLSIEREKTFVKLGMIADGFDGNEIDALLAANEKEIAKILNQKQKDD